MADAAADSGRFLAGRSTGGEHERLMSDFTYDPVDMDPSRRADVRSGVGLSLSEEGVSEESDDAIKMLSRTCEIKSDAKSSKSDMRLPNTRNKSPNPIGRHTMTETRRVLESLSAPAAVADGMAAAAAASGEFLQRRTLTRSPTAGMSVLQRSRSPTNTCSVPTAVSDGMADAAADSGRFLAGRSTGGERERPMSDFTYDPVDELEAITMLSRTCEIKPLTVRFFF